MIYSGQKNIQKLEVYAQGGHVWVLLGKSQTANELIYVKIDVHQSTLDVL